MPENLRHSLLLLITATIWGTGFVAQALGMEYISPFAFTWGRSVIGAAFVFAILPVFDRLRGMTPASTKNVWKDKTLWIGGFACGTVLFISESLQQFGLLGTEVGKASFITSLYIVIVPVIGIFIGRRSSLNIWLAVILAVAGLWFLCMKPETGFTLSLGDSLVLACALSFSFHILVIDHFAPKTDGVRMSCIQFAVGGVWGFILMMFFDPPTLKDLWDAVWMLLYAGILSNGIAYTLQIVGQKGLNPTVASLIMSFEAVVGVLAGWLFMNQALTGRELIGCAVMAAAIILAQLPAKWFGR